MPEKPIRRVAIAIDMDWPYKHHVGIVSGVQRYARETGNWEYYLDPFVRTLPLHRRRSFHYDGVLGRIDRDMDRRLKRACTPSVNTWSNSPVRNCPHVRPDFAFSGRMAAEHLMGRGIRRFGYLGYRDNRSDEPQEETFREEVSRRGFQCESRWIEYGCLSHSDAFFDFQQTVSAWISGWNPPIGIFVNFDLCARYLVDLCRHRGLRVPEDVAILSTGNEQSVCLNQAPTISSIGLGYEEVGYRAAEVLNHLMDGRPPPDGPILVPPRTVWARQSTDVLAVDDPLVASALRIISERGHEGIGVADVAAALAVTRRTLERRFRKILDKGVHGEIARLRIERVKRQLMESEESIKAIARDSGFEDAKQLTVLFHRLEGISPTQYRLTRR